MRRGELLQDLSGGGLRGRLSQVYGAGAAETAVRLRELVLEYAGTFPCDESADTWLFSTPGRTELGGNHTDHQRGAALAGSVNLDTIACVVPNRSRTIRIKSRHHRIAEVNLDDLSILYLIFRSGGAFLRARRARGTFLRTQTCGAHAGILIFYFTISPRAAQGPMCRKCPYFRKVFPSPVRFPQIGGKSIDIQGEWFIIEDNWASPAQKIVVMIEARPPSVPPRKPSDSGGGKGNAAEAPLPLSGGRGGWAAGEHPADCHGNVESCHGGSCSCCASGHDCIMTGLLFLGGTHMNTPRTRRALTAVLALSAALALTATAFASEGEAPLSNMYGTFMALVPPVVAIVLALITKEAYSSLFIGVLVGALFK